MSLNNEKQEEVFLLFFVGFYFGTGDPSPTALFIFIRRGGGAILFTVCRGYLTEDGLFSFYASTKSAYTDIF
ncbi:MAG: hypothetical protein IIX84_03650, partial [Oscillospiraceae bacterium]|nr:hypothetical protein [Oscillospiraceae bacterium]